MTSQSSFTTYESRPDTPAFDPSRRPSSQDTVTSAVVHAIHLMQTAVDANRTSHFRPASSCFVVAVKSILHATDTLAKDSVILRTHLVLARQRKQILSNLANVMTLARNASAENLDIISRARETGLMLQTANVALDNVETFLHIAMQCGVDVPSRIESEMDDRQTQQRITNMQNVSTPMLDACLQFPETTELSFLATNARSGSTSLHRATPSSASSAGKSLHKTRSLSDMKNVPKRKMSEASNTSSGTSSSHGATAAGPSAGPSYAFLGKPPSPTEVPRRPAQNVRRPSIPAAYAATVPSSTWQANDSISSSASSLSSSQGPHTPVDTSTPQQPTEVYRTLALIHDQLLSTIAAFIGHVHAHSRTSHSSSYAHLIDMTRESIERVRETLLIVDVIIAHPALSAFSRDLKYLAKCREALYLATTALVTAARNATAPLSPELTNESLIHDQEEEEKQELLKAATGVLRASADCVNSTKPLLLRRRGSDASFVIDLQQSASSELSRSSSGSTEAPLDEDATVQVTDSGIGSEDNTHMGGNREGDKGRHTISMLARKATSLTCMRDTPQQSGDDSHLADASLELVEELTGDEYEDADENQQNRLRADLEAVWVQQEQQQRRGSQSVPASARNSYHFPRSDTPSSDERSVSSLSTRRGMPIPPNLTIQTRYPALKTRPPSLGSMSATSTVTSMSRDKSATPAPFAKPVIPTSEPKSASSLSTTSSDSYKAGGEAMSRDESSRGSAASTATSSYRSGVSDANTADTSPRSSLACPSPAEDNAGWLHGDAAAAPAGKRPSRSEAYRARSGSTPDRVAALRISEGASGLFSPLSPRSPHVLSQPETVINKNWLLERDYEPKECSFNADGNVTGGTLRCLVERMTLHDQTIDASFSTTFFLTFRMFTIPLELTGLLIARFNITPPSSTTLSEVEHKIWREQKLTPVRLRIYNFFKIWLETHWRPSTDSVILDTLQAFTRQTMMPAMPAAAQRLIDLLQKRAIVTQAVEGGRIKTLARMASTDKLKAGKPISDGLPLGSATFPGPGSSLPPSPILSKGLLNALRTPPYAPSSILDFDPLELARQFTILESRLYCAILPEDLIGQEFGKSGSNRSTNIRAMSSLSTRITGWIAEIILSEQDAKKRSGLVKYFIKLGDVRIWHHVSRSHSLIVLFSQRCMQLQNYNTLMAILAALNSSTIARLKKTWEGLSNKHKATLETLRRTTEHTRNYAQYRATIRAAVAPCLPFLGLTLTDLTFCQDGNAAERTSPLDSNLRLINFDRYQVCFPQIHWKILADPLNCSCRGLLRSSTMFNASRCHTTSQKWQRFRVSYRMVSSSSLLALYDMRLTVISPQPCEISSTAVTRKPCIDAVW